jgi:hypothetical protein
VLFNSFKVKWLLLGYPLTQKYCRVKLNWVNNNIYYLQLGFHPVAVDNLMYLMQYLSGQSRFSPTESLSVSDPKN